MAEVVKVCDLGMVAATYRYVVPKGNLPGYAYRVSVSGKHKAHAQFDIPQASADQFATELEALAALIRAHAILRKSD